MMMMMMMMMMMIALTVAAKAAGVAAVTRLDPVWWIQSSGRYFAFWE